MAKIQSKCWQKFSRVSPIGGYLMDMLTNVHRIYWRKPNRFLIIEMEHSYLCNTQEFVEAAPKLFLRVRSAHPNFRNIKVQHCRGWNRWIRKDSSLPWIRSLQVWASKTEFIFLEDRLRQSYKKPKLFRQKWIENVFRRESLSHILNYVYTYADYQHKKWLYEKKIQ